ncbi:MAG: hypothetical protein QOJ29_2799 [Thermoleophilaceae bacterium]|nr:hypothetical protein [Thermoleophilaceae bacterium]
MRQVRTKVIATRNLLALVTTLGVFSGLVATAGAYGAGGGVRANPPNGIYTCDWIANHPTAAAAAGVSCSSTPPPISAQDPMVILPASTFGRDTLDSGTYCFRLPTSGYVGKGVFAWTAGYPYSQSWSIIGYVAYDYTWYVQNSGGTNVHVEAITDSYDHSTFPGWNYYREGAQNHANANVYWGGCYSN